MKKVLFLSGIIVTLLISSLNSYAGDWTADQKAVWKAIEAQWAATKNKDANWAKNMLSDNFSGWSKDGVMPRSKSSEESWSRFNMKSSSRLMQELHPVKIVVHKDMAFAHYFYEAVSENKDGKRNNTDGRWTDILVRDGKAWKFIGWQGGEHDNDD